MFRNPFCFTVGTSRSRATVLGETCKVPESFWGCFNARPEKFAIGEAWGEEGHCMIRVSVCASVRESPFFAPKMAFAGDNDPVFVPSPGAGA